MKLRKYRFAMRNTLFMFNLNNKTNTFAVLSNVQIYFQTIGLAKILTT